MSFQNEVLLKKNGVVIAGLRNASISWSGESVDLTTGENAGKRLLAAKSAQEQIDISAEGITKSDLLRGIALGSDSKLLTDITFEYDIINPANTIPAKISGNFRLSSFEEGKPYKEGISFSLSLESSGPWAYTPEAA